MNNQFDDEIYEYSDKNGGESFLDWNDNISNHSFYGSSDFSAYKPNGYYNESASMPTKHRNEIQRGDDISPKSKRGTKVFLVIMGVIIQLSIISFAAIGVYNLVFKQTPVVESDNNELEYDLPEDIPNPEIEQPEIDLPEIEVPKNYDGILLNAPPETEELAPEDVYNKVLPSTVTITAEYISGEQMLRGYGTGIIATSDGFIITNSHVVNDSRDTKVTVATYDGVDYEAVVVGVDRFYDLAVLKTDDHNFTPAEFGDSEELNMGQWVMAIGSPGKAEFSGSVTRGIVSGLERTLDNTDNAVQYIQTDTAINPGNSGGPLVNMYGQVVGINVLKIVGTYYENLGFSIPVTDAKEIIDQLLVEGYVEGRVRFGITVTQFSQSGVAFGVEILSLDENSVFNGTGVEVGDIMIAVGDSNIQTLDDLTEALFEYNLDDTVDVRFMKADGSEQYTVNVGFLADEGQTQ